MANEEIIRNAVAEGIVSLQSGAFRVANRMNRLSLAQLPTIFLNLPDGWHSPFRSYTHVHVRVSYVTKF